MAINTMLLVALVLSPMALSMKLNGASDFSSEAPPITMLTDVTMDSSQAEAVSEMGKVFVRSRAAQRQSMDTISKSMTLQRAVQTLEKSALTHTPMLKQITGLLSSSQNLRKHLVSSSQNLRKHLEAHDGFGGLDGARLLLNDMIYEVMVKYDAEITKCTSYYASQCALMEVARGQISAANFVAATARALIMDSQANINHCEIRSRRPRQNWGITT
jgi:hypothetical protein